MLLSSPESIWQKNWFHFQLKGFIPLFTLSINILVTFLNLFDSFFSTYMYDCIVWAQCFVDSTIKQKFILQSYYRPSFLKCGSCDSFAAEYEQNLKLFCDILNFWFLCILELIYRHLILQQISLICSNSFDRVWRGKLEDRQIDNIKQICTFYSVIKVQSVIWSFHSLH